MVLLKNRKLLNIIKNRIKSDQLDDMMYSYVLEIVSVQMFRSARETCPPPFILSIERGAYTNTLTVFILVCTIYTFGINAAVLCTNAGIDFASYPPGDESRRTEMQFRFVTMHTKID